MNSKELRAACEAAGMKTRPKPIAPGWEASMDAPGVQWLYDDDDPALPAYVASLLVAKVAAHEVAQFRYQATMAGEVNAGIGFAARAMFASDEQRIRAAMAALEHSPTTKGG